MTNGGTSPSNPSQGSNPPATNGGTPPSNPSQGSNPPATNGGTPPSNPSQGSNPLPPPSPQFGGTFNQIDVKGNTVYLTISDKNNLTHNNILLSGGEFDNVRNGKFVTSAHKALKSTSDNPDDIAFGDAFFTAFGQLTSLSDMPNGQATYKGNAFYIHEDAKNAADIATGTAQFNVNFSTKRVDGNITVTGHPVVKLPTATIDGNKFEGSLNNLSVKGHFYGSQAAELGGIYDFDPPNGNGEKGFMGSFGATKQ